MMDSHQKPSSKYYHLFFNISNSNTVIIFFYTCAICVLDYFEIFLLANLPGSKFYRANLD